MELRHQLENFEQAYLRGEINALNISARFKKIAETILYGDRLPNPPYFPIMSLHAHMSGFDITFESEEGKYRASALIRKYSVYKNVYTGKKWKEEKGLYDYEWSFSAIDL